MKKIGKMLPVLLLFICLSLPNIVFANEDTRRVFDYADLLTEEEEEKLNELCLEKEDALETELYILTTLDTEGKKTVNYVDDFGDNHAFGYDKEYGNYMILCIDMQNRIVWLSTSGKAEEYFTEARIDTLLDNLYPALKAERYYDTCYSYLQSGEKYLSEEPSYTGSDPSNYPETMFEYDEEGKPFYKYWYVRLLIAAVAGAIVVSAMSYRASSRITVNARTYSNNMRINQHTDAFVRRTTSSRRIETNTSSSGGSSSGGGGHHTSSGGHSHGGGGRSF